MSIKEGNLRATIDYIYPLSMVQYFYCNGKTLGFKLKLKKYIFYLLIFREKGKEGERETLMCGCLSRTPNWGPGLQPRHVP